MFSNGVSSDKCAVRLKAISKSFGNIIAVNNIDLDIDNGEILVLLGPSGCGKTTTLRMIAGFETPENGRIFIKGEDVTLKLPRERNIGMVFQDYALFPHMNVFENIAFGLRIRKMPYKDIKQVVQQNLELVGLKGFENRKPKQLSGGQQQRVALGRALAIQPDVLLLDEPLGALDKKLREELQIELRNLIKKVGITAIVVTHDQEEALSLSDRIAVMNNGNLEQVDSPFDIYERPQSIFVASFVGTSNMLRGTVIGVINENSVIETEDGLKIFVNKIEKLGQKIVLIIRPENIEILSKNSLPESMIEGKNIFSAVINSQNYLGAKVIYSISLMNNRKILAEEKNIFLRKKYIKKSNVKNEENQILIKFDSKKIFTINDY